jgi:hypothetical protein
MSSFFESSFLMFSTKIYNLLMSMGALQRVNDSQILEALRGSLVYYESETLLANNEAAFAFRIEKSESKAIQEAMFIPWPQIQEAMRKDIELLAQCGHRERNDLLAFVNVLCKPSVNQEYLLGLAETIQICRGTLTWVRLDLPFNRSGKGIRIQLSEFCRAFNQIQSNQSNATLILNWFSSFFTSQ